MKQDESRGLTFGRVNESRRPAVIAYPSVCNLLARALTWFALPMSRSKLVCAPRRKEHARRFFKTNFLNSKFKIRMARRLKPSYMINSKNVSTKSRNHRTHASPFQSHGGVERIWAVGRTTAHPHLAATSARLWSRKSSTCAPRNTTRPRFAPGRRSPRHRRRTFPHSQSRSSTHCFVTVSS